MRLDQTRGRVPVTVSVSPAGSEVAVSVLARLAGKWVRVGRAIQDAEQAGTNRVKVPVKPRWRDSLDGLRVKAKVVVAVTSPTGAGISTAERFWLRG